MAGNYVIHDVAIFDGEQLLDGRHTVVIDAGRIADILPAGAVPASLLEEARSSGRLVAGEGRTLLPGLIGRASCRERV